MIAIILEDGPHAGDEYGIEDLVWDWDGSIEHRWMWDGWL